MRRLVLIPLLTAACDANLGEPPPSDEIAASVYNDSALAAFSPGDRAYVMGHAMGVYLYGKTLPSHVVGTGFDYRPGVSSGIARVVYKFDEVVTAHTGGTCNFDTCNGGDGAPPQSDDPFVDEDCETFLDPAALEARGRADKLDVPGLIGSLDEKRFRLGLADALSVEDLEENTDHSEIEHLKPYVQDAGMCEHSPLVVDLAGDGIAASPPEVRFDLKATGVPFLVAWPRGDDALLALDRDGDGRITSGRELFGNHDAANGFETLAAHDHDGDGVIDARDPVFASLRLWRDANRDGASDDGELVPLASEGISALPLAYTTSDARDPFGNLLAQHGTFRRADGTSGAVIDVWFRLRR